MSRKKKSAEPSSGEAQNNDAEAQHYASGAECGSDEFAAREPGEDNTAGDDAEDSRGDAEGAENNAAGDGDETGGDDSAGEDGGTDDDEPTPMAVSRLLKSRKWSIRVDYTPEEKVEFAQRMTEAQKEIAQIEAEKKRANSQFKTRIEEATGTRNEMMERIHCGYEMRELECQVLADTPAPGKKSLINPITGETVRIETMSPDEKQTELPLGDSERNDPKPTIPHRQTRGGNVAVPSDGETLNDHTDKEDY